jgi:hypothetical protein
VTAGNPVGIAATAVATIYGNECGTERIVCPVVEATRRASILVAGNVTAVDPSGATNAVIAAVQCAEGFT